MREKFEVTKQVVPNYIIKNLRERRGLSSMDVSEDEEILKMSSWEFLDDWLAWNGIMGYTSDIIEVVGLAFGINLTDSSLDEAPEREL